jgi:NAD(P)-dependent dehydrogenase (short-subunit alcohol dehydrogenase family)
VTATATVQAFAPAQEPATAGSFERRCWHIIGDENHAVAFELRARSAPPGAGPCGTAVLLGRQFGWEDNARLLDGIAAACRDGGRLALVHLGAGGASLLRVAATENPGLDVVSVELSPQPSPRAVRVATTVANSCPARVLELQIDDQGRITRTVWQPVELPPPATGPSAAPASVLITGGLGGLGVRAAHMLARTVGLHPLIVDHARLDSLGAGVARHLAYLHNSPTGCTVLDVDLTDHSATMAALSDLDTPPVSAVVHCAGVLLGGPLSAFAALDLAAAQRVKVDGLRNVLDAVDTNRLRHLVTFGSVTAEQPHRSMACYALANELLRRATFDAARALPCCATVAAEWSLWSGAGMAYRAGAIPQARRMGMTPVSLRAGMSALACLLGWPPGPQAATALVLSGSPAEQLPRIHHRDTAGAVA